MSHIRLFWHEYKYFPYEREFALREVRRLLKPNTLVVSEKELTIENSLVDDDLLRKLVYFRGYLADENLMPTLQHQLESTCVRTGIQKRQSTRYSVHGLHEYKGKFNPQIVRGILNVLGLTPGGIILDPFCGSGTTLVECAHANMQSYGFDINPLAVFLSNAKLQALTVDSTQLREELDYILAQFRGGANSHDNVDIYDAARFAYLAKWFSEPWLTEIERLRVCIQACVPEAQNIFLAIASDLLRDYSLQEPADLRIRRRRSPMPARPLIEAFQKKASYFIDNLAGAQSVLEGIGKGRAYLIDNRQLSKQWVTHHPEVMFDAAITSPPYATALPYIDTQRLSLVWLGLCKPGDLKYLEEGLTGSREVLGKNKPLWQERLRKNLCGVEASVYEFCMELLSALSDQDGFRRQAVPVLLYRYFCNMRETFIQVRNVVKNKAPFALVVGHNHTTLGGRRFDIDTPKHLRRLAESCGWKLRESYPLQTYHRYNMHSANSVKLETLLILEKS